jgi:hypothetical protein
VMISGKDNRRSPLAKDMVFDVSKMRKSHDL